MRVLLLFSDGVGLGADDPSTNPFLSASLPAFDELLGHGGLTARRAPHHGAAASVVAVDATLGCAGTPQSGTGQAALLTGSNAVQMHGRHFGPWVPARLQRMVRDESVLARARDDGYSIAFANAYPEEILPSAGGDAPRIPSDAPGVRTRRAPSFLRAGPPLAALGAGVLTRHTPELERGDAVASEITNDGWRARLGRTGVPAVAAADAGRNLARIVAQHDLTLFAHYATDYAGHSGEMQAAVAALERLDAFVGGVLQSVPDDTLLFLVSDHGNIEDITQGHTRNPAVGIVAGNGHALIARRLRDLTDVTPVILDVLAI